jgi:integrase
MADIGRPKRADRLMSVQRHNIADGTRWKVRWRQADGVMRARSFTSKQEAIAFDADVKARKYKGETLPRAHHETIAEAFDEWWRLRGSTKAPATQRTYLAAWNPHVRGRFDHHDIHELVSNPQLLDELAADMRERGVGNAAQRKVLVVLSAVLTAAVEWRRIPVNPVLAMHKPPGTRERIPHPFPPVVVERIRLRMTRRETKDPTGTRAMGDACLVSLLSYAGLRPGEALALTWGDIGTRAIAVDKSVSDGCEGPTKTGAVRSVPLAQPLATDMAEFRYALNAPSDDALVFAAADRDCWSRSDWNNWRNRVWNPTMSGLAQGEEALQRLATAVPYDCRASFVSLYLRAGHSPLEVAQWAGHSPAVMFKHYAHVIDELVGEPVLPVNEQIIRARVAVKQMSPGELDDLAAELLQRPKVGAGSGVDAMYSPHVAPDIPKDPPKTA